MQATDSKLDGVNDVRIGGADGIIVPWAVAFPRPEWTNPDHWAASRPEGAKTDADRS
jgi:hypothetical protein